MNDYAAFEYALAATILVLAMVGMGASLTLREFLHVLRAPQGVLLVWLVQALIGPLLALAISYLLAVPRPIAVGMLVIASLPGGSYSNLLTYLGRGNIPLSVAATAVSTAGCLVTTPFILATFGAHLIPAHVTIPVSRIVMEIAGWLLAPLAAGMWLRHQFPFRAVLVERSCIRGSVVLLIVLVVSSLAMSRLKFFEYGWRAPLALVLLAVTWLWVTYGLSLLCRFPLRDTFTLGIEVVVRNGNLGLLLAASLFPAEPGQTHPLGAGVLYVVLVYTGLKLVVGGSEVYAMRNQVGLLFHKSTPASRTGP